MNKIFFFFVLIALTQSSSAQTETTTVRELISSWTTIYYTPAFKNEVLQYMNIQNASNVAPNFHSYTLTESKFPAEMTAEMKPFSISDYGAFYRAAFEGKLNNTVLSKIKGNICLVDINGSTYWIFLVWSAKLQKWIVNSHPLDDCPVMMFAKGNICFSK